MTHTENTSSHVVTDPRPLFARAVALGAEVIGAVRPDRLGDPTPCDEFDVAALLDHLVMVLERVAAMGRGESALSVQQVERSGGWADAWAAATREYEAAWAEDAVLERTVTLPWTTMSGDDALRIYLNEVTVHTWDLASATGQKPAWDDEVVNTAYDAMRAGLPAEGRQALARQAPPGTPVSVPFADAVDVPAEAAPIERLVAWSGRRP